MTVERDHYSTEKVRTRYVGGIGLLTNACQGRLSNWTLCTSEILFQSIASFGLGKIQDRYYILHS